jgi:hypothetical protein
VGGSCWGGSACARLITGFRRWFSGPDNNTEFKGRHVLRRVHVLASAGAVLLLASCSGKPNDLAGNRYYEDPDPVPTAAAQAPPGPTATTSALAQPRQEVVNLDRFALTAADLAEEGVQPAGTTRTRLTVLPDCQAPLGAAKSAFQTTWAYPTGSTVRQYLAEYEDEAATDVVTGLKSSLTCTRYRADNADVRVSAPVDDGNGQVSWCATSTKQATCTVVAAAGPVLSVVVVTAATESKAKPAVTRIAPLAATVLTRNS